MSLYPNPFESRASEQQRDVHQFVSTFGPGAIDLLPTAVWDRLVVLRSSPGAGKTSLMRLFTTETLMWICGRYDRSEHVHRLLTEREVLEPDGSPRKLGVLLPLDRDYLSLVDLPVGEASADRLFLRLLDSRILTSVLRASLSASGLEFPADIDRFRLDVSAAEARTQAAVEKIGGVDGSAIVNFSRRTERQVLALLDAVLSVELESGADGHAELLSLSILEECEITVDGRPLGLQPLLMFDDGHELASRQRRALLDNLRRRRPGVARWYSERFEAMSNQELMQGFGIEGRDLVEIDIDYIFRNGAGRRFTASQHDKVLSYIALQRAAPVLMNYAQESQPFFEFLESPEAAPLPDKFPSLQTALQTRVLEASGSDARYSTWVEDADLLTGRDASVRWRELEILIARDMKGQQDLFGDPLTGDDLSARSSSALRDAADLSVATEFGLPYYAGRDRLLALGSHNVEQFLNLCGALFEDLLIDISLGRKPTLTAARQDKILRQASETYWESIARTVPNGRDVRAIVAEIVRIAVEENKKPTVPYPPGVTGTALLMSDRERLLDVDYRNRNSAAERLFAALASAVAYNVITADFDYSVKNNKYMVLYLNRLLCPCFGLPLGRGAFRERKLSQMLTWVEDLPDSGHRDPREWESSLGL